MSKYRLIYADPPWQYRNKKTGGSMTSGADSKYPTMSLDELKALKLPAGPDCALFLWSTVPMLPDALTLMSAWGFKYKTTLFWRKIMALGMGFWFRGQVEMILLGIKGNVRAFRIQKANFIQAKSLRHSEKPEEFRRLVEMTGLKPRLEMFARRRTKGWDCHGNEIKDGVVIKS